MLSTSQAYQTAIEKSTRSTVASIYFGVYDVTAKPDSSPVASNSQAFTDIVSIKDGIRSPEFNMATFEDDFFELDGSFILTPDTVSTSNILGWWSSAISDSNGDFSVPPTVTITFSQVHSSFGIGLFFDPLGNTFCTDFDITWYNGVTQLDYLLVQENTQIGCNIQRGVSNYNKIVVRFLKTNAPYRYVKLMEMNFGLEEVFDSDSLISASIVEEVDPSNAVLTINKLKFTVLNTDQKFNMANPQGLYAYLQKKQQIVASSGVLLSSGKYEYVQMGTYYLSDWKNATGITATLEATDAIGLLDKTTYYSSQFWVNATISSVIQQILNDAGTFPVIIDSSASGEVVNGYLPIMSHREALQAVLMACRCTLRINRDGIIHIMKLDYTTPVDTIEYDVIIGTPQIEQKQLISAVSVKEHTYTLNSVSEQIYQATFTQTGQSTLILPYDKAPASNVSVAVTGSGTIVGSPVYSATSVTVAINGTGTFTVTVTGKVYADVTKPVVASIALSAGEVPQTADVADNTLVTSANSSNVANFLLTYYGKRIKQTFNFWDDPSIQSGDCIAVQTMFGQNQNGVVERQEITFAPNLKARIEVTG
ncbi:MAG: hypothetical protein N3B21_19270 [Clostridia bacterium]|nr:hypothetical protein [Clostridia bacterium]